MNPFDTCRFCGKKFGLLPFSHNQCEKKFKQSQKHIDDIVISSFRHGINRERIEASVNLLANEFNLDIEGVKPILLSAWGKCVDDALSDNLLTEIEEKRLVELLLFFNFTKEEVRNHPAYLMVTKGAILREIYEGKIPSRCDASFGGVISVPKDEKVIWVFSNTIYCENKSRMERQKTNQFVRGYHKSGTFKGNPIQVNYVVKVDGGILTVTDKHIIFAGPIKSIKIRHDKILTRIPYDDGIGICKDSASAKTQLFITHDGWFTYNLICGIRELLQ